jgi:phosphoglycerol transferase MdoB-like AlkP superfamily enzyme
MSVLMLIFSLCRAIFYIRNSAYFSNVGFQEIMAGFWFDLIATSLLFFPILAIELFPNKNRSRKWFKGVLTLITACVFIFGIAINLIDVEYFAFSSARSTAALFVMLGFGSDLQSQLPSFLSDYWYLFVIFAAFMLAGFWLLKKSYQKADDSQETSLIKQTIIYVLTFGCILFFARGGWVYKPIRATEASKYTEISNIPLVLNSAFTVINSWGSSSLEEKEYMPAAEALALFDPIHNYGDSSPLKNQNICVIILESFSIEFINSLNVDEQEWTPFFDQLVDSSLVFPNAFANGKKSIDAVPSIIASIPKMMQEEYLLSNYAINEVETLPILLGEMGYSSGFFHGATNGSMNFDAFCSLAGFDNYYGRSEYDNDAHFDGTWGIYDEEFMSWSIDKFSEMREPFFTSLFTISSHPPYDLPQRYSDSFKNSKTDMQRVIQYTDMALKKFFEKAKTTAWYENTLFILTADHTPNSSREIYLHDRGKMNIPLIFYHPTDTFYRGINERIVGHIDIMPTLLDLVGYQNEFFSFGHSAFDATSAYTFSEVADKKMLFEAINDEPHLLIFQNDQGVALYSLLDLYQEKDLINERPLVLKNMEKRLKAIIQIYSSSISKNQTTSQKFFVN